MESPGVTAEMGNLATWVGSIGTVSAVVAASVVALWQLRVQRKQAAIERTIAAHRDLTSGEVGVSRDRLSELMWRAGSAAGKNKCLQPTWEQLLGSTYVELPVGLADLSCYPPDMEAPRDQTPMRDLYKVLWNSERVEAAYDAGLLDSELSVKMIASHVVWWENLRGEIPSSKTRYRQNLTNLAAKFGPLDPELQVWVSADFDTS